MSTAIKTQMGALVGAGIILLLLVAGMVAFPAFASANTDKPYFRYTITASNNTPGAGWEQYDKNCLLSNGPTCIYPVALWRQASSTPYHYVVNNGTNPGGYTAVQTFNLPATGGVSAEISHVPFTLWEKASTLGVGFDLKLGHAGAGSTQGVHCATSPHNPGNEAHNIWNYQHPGYTFASRAVAYVFRGAEISDICVVQKTYGVTTPTATPDDDSDKEECRDGKDNDGDGVEDEADAGCHTDGDATDGDDTYNPNDDSEENGQCADGKDNDSDGYTDRRDPDCHSDNNPNNDSSYNGNLKEDTVNKKPVVKGAAVHATPVPVAVPVTAKTGAGMIGVVSTLVGGAALSLIKRNLL